MQLHLHGDSYDDDVPSPSPSPISLQLGTTTSEDLLCDLGPAVRSWWKEDDRMAIHSSLKSTDPSLERELIWTWHCGLAPLADSAFASESLLQLVPASRPHVHAAPDEACSDEDVTSFELAGRDQLWSNGSS